MGNFHRGGDRNKSNGGGFGGNRRGGFGEDRGERREVTMHRAVCSDCGNTCEVPFKPSGSKPVFCNDCFGSKKGDDRGERSNDRFERPERRNDRGTKERYISTPRVNSPVVSNNEETKKQLSDIVSKLDKLTSILEKMSNQHESHMAAKVEVTEVKKQIKKEVKTKAVAKVAAKKVANKKNK